MKDSVKGDFLVILSLVADGLARCTSIAPSADVYLEVNDASQGHAHAVFSRAESGDVLVYVEVT